jgi:hypothetical protein
MKEHRDLTEAELREMKAIIDANMQRFVLMVDRDPSIRRAVAKCELGAAVALCHCFGVDALAEVKTFIAEYGVADELIPPVRN